VLRDEPSQQARECGRDPVEQGAVVGVMFAREPRLQPVAVAGEPVRDAVTKVAVPEAGKYHLWVRCKDWDKTSPGKFQIIVNGKASATTFGAQKNNWSWIAGGAFDLVVSNPPYVAADDPHLSAGDPRFEPAGALASGVDGLAALRIRDVLIQSTRMAAKS